ncbi:hypothetical protein [Mycolicibacterium sp.]
MSVLERLIQRFADGEIRLITDEGWLPNPIDDIWPQMRVKCAARETTVDN